MFDRKNGVQDMTHVEFDTNNIKYVLKNGIDQCVLLSAFGPQRYIVTKMITSIYSCLIRDVPPKTAKIPALKSLTYIPTENIIVRLRNRSKLKNINLPY